MNVLCKIRPLLRGSGTLWQNSKTQPAWWYVHTSTSIKNTDDNSKKQADQKPQQFDESLLKYIVCPLSKSALRYDKQTNELICDKLRVAYPIVNGIPNLIPQDARKLPEDNQS